MRLLAVLELLQARREMTGVEIAERLQVDPRSVRRYIKALQEMEIPIEAERGRYGAYRLDRGFKLPPMMFTEDEAAALTLGLMVIRAFAFPIDQLGVAGALAKIERVLPQALLDQTMALQESLHFDYLLPAASIQSGVIKALLAAMQQGRRLQVQYRSWNNERTPAGLHLTALALAQRATCPRCETASTRIHSYYTRRPHDLPMCGLPIRLLLHVRRFRCLNPTCPARTFSERLPLLIASAAQRTVRLNDALRDLALAVGGEAGACQSARSAMPASGDTLLRRAHGAPPLAVPTPRVRGIDDFSFRKGQVFGTLLTDGERHTVVDMLPDRTAETAAAWLQKHPGVELVTRDRSADYNRAISIGAPHAIQVADRFHLAKM